MTTQTQSAPVKRTARKDSARRSSKSSIHLAITFWLFFAGLCLIANALLVNETLAVMARYAAAVVSLALALLLGMGKAWARPAAVIYHIWVGGLLAVVGLRAADFFAAMVSNLPGWLTTDTWATLLRFAAFSVAAISFVIAYLLEQESAWLAFVNPSKQRSNATLCPTCGATRARDDDGNQSCAYCDSSGAQTYFLQPVLKNARRIPLEFEPGHERIRIGRTVGNGEAWIDANENKRYRTISRHHADIELNLKSGDMSIHKAFTSQEVLVDNQPVLMSAPVKLGSMIQLGKVQFVLGNSEYEPTLAYFVDQTDENRRYLLRFNGIDNEQTIGRSRDNNIVLSDKRDVSGRHAAIIFDPGSDMFFIRNESERRPIYIDGHLLEPGRTTELSNDELIIVQLGAHNFNFLPVLYQPKGQERLHA